jgi:hypothetical protein
VKVGKTKLQYNQTPYRNSSEAASTNVEIEIVGTTPKDEQLEVIWIRWQEKLE